MRLVGDDCAEALFGRVLDEMLEYTPPYGVGDLWIGWAAALIVLQEDPQQIADALVTQWKLARSFEAGEQTHRWFDAVREGWRKSDVSEEGMRRIQDWVRHCRAERWREED